MRKIKGFKNTNILTEHGIIKTNLIVEDGVIKSIGPCECQGLIELDDKYIVIPGLIDQHIHGASGVDVIDGNVDDVAKMAHALSVEGVTAFLSTTTTQSIEVIDASLEAIKTYINQNNITGAEVLGVHLEGPFLSRKYAGAQLPDYLLKPSVEDFKHFEEVSGNTIKLVTLAIEEEGAFELMKYLKERNIVISAGHTAAGFKDMEKGVENGLTCVTHTYNGMRPLRRDDIGTVGSAFLFDELYCEAICDGVHISKPALRVLCKNKQMDKIILITDALRTKYMPEGIYYELEQVLVLKDDVARLEDGRLAGSCLKLNKAIKNMMDFAKINFEQAVKFATENPAKNLGVFDKMGSIKENKLANFAIVDKDLNVYQTIRLGREIYNKQEEKNEL